MSTVRLGEARAAVSDLAPRFSALVRSVRDPARHAIGDWSVGDVACHMSHVALLEAGAAKGHGSEPMSSFGLPEVNAIGDVGALNRAGLDRDPERDPAVLAGRFEEGVGELLDACRGEDVVVPWLLGARLPLSSLCSHMVEEMTLHGFDIARASNLPWTIYPEHARIAIEGFFLPVVSQLGVRFAADGLGSASCEIRLRGGGRWVFASDGDGLTVGEAGREVDLRISADPVAMLLVMGGRSGRLRPALKGKMVAWGRRPMRAMKMLSAIKAP